MRESFNQTYFFENEMIAFGARPPHEYRPSLRLIPCGYAFFCVWCSDVWARVETGRTVEEMARPKSSRNFFIIERDCMRCGGSGSMWIPHNCDYQNHLPRKMLFRELEIAYSDATANPRRRL